MPAFALAAGILLSESVPTGAGAMAGLCGGVVLACLCVVSALRGSPRAARLGLAGAVFAAGLARLALDRRPDPSDLGHWQAVEGPAAVTGVVIRGPEAFGGAGDADGAAPGSWMILEIDGAEGAGRAAVTGRVRVVVGNGTPDLREGDRVRAAGWLSAPRGAGNPGEFDFAAYLARQGIRRSLRVSRVEHVQSLARGRGPLAWRGAARDRLGRAFGAIGSEGRLYGALVLGDRSRLDDDLENAFVTSGTAHVLAVSGLNLVLAMAMAGGLARLLGAGLRTSSLVAVGVALAYAALVGWSPPVTRAAAMGAAFAGGRILLRRGDPLNSLAAAALIDLAIFPEDLFSAGFHLSFAAVAALVLGAGPIASALAPVATPGLWTRLRRGVASSLGASAAAGIATAPLTLAHFNIVAPISLLANLAVVPLAAVLLGMGVLAALLGTIDPALVRALAPVFAAPAQAGEWLVRFLGAVPGGHFWLPAPPAAWTATALAALALARRSPRAAAAVGAGLAAALAALAAVPPDPAFRGAFLDVGQGACTVLEFPEGDLWVVDCGVSGRSDPGARVAAPYLWSRRRRTIDTLVLTHADADHISGAPSLFERFHVRRLVVPEAFLADPRAREVLRSAGDVPVITVAAGDRLRTGAGREVPILSPPADSFRWKSNDTSIVCLVDGGGLRLLLTGDAESRSIRTFLSRVPRVDVLQVPHHGGASSRSLELPGRARPAVGVISAREWFASPEVEADYAALGVPLEETWRNGAIVFEAEGGRRRWWRWADGGDPPGR